MSLPPVIFYWMFVPLRDSFNLIGHTQEYRMMLALHDRQMKIEEELQNQENLRFELVSELHTELKLVKMQMEYICMRLRLLMEQIEQLPVERSHALDETASEFGELSDTMIGEEQA